VPSPNIKATDTIEQGRVKINNHFNDPSEHGGGFRGGFQEGVFNVKSYGASGTGSGGASQDQSGFAAAVTGANDFSNGRGTVYIPPGSYLLAGGFTLGKHVRVVGAGTHQVYIKHTGNNRLFENLVVQTGGDILKRRGFSGMQIEGNSGDSAQGIVHGNGYGALIQDVTITAYTGTNGKGIAALNTDPNAGWTEGTVYRDVHVRSCTRNLSFEEIGMVGSFSDTRLHNVLSVSESWAGANQAGIYVSSHAAIYCSEFLTKVHIEHADAIGLFLGRNAALYSDLFSLYFEIAQTPSPGKGGLVVDTEAKILAGGIVSPAPGDVNAAGDPWHTIHRDARVDVGPRPGSWYRLGGKSDEHYAHVATLPASATDTHDKLVVEITGGEWRSGSRSVTTYTFANRGGFQAEYSRVGSQSDPDVMAVVAYQRTAGDTDPGSVDVYIRTPSGAYASGNVRAYGVSTFKGLSPAGYGTSHTHALKPPNTATPAGTKVFDSATATPSAPIEAGSFIGTVAASQSVDNNTQINVSPAATVYPVTPSSEENKSGVRISVGNYPGQKIEIVHRGGAHTLTFHTTPATSRVAEATYVMSQNRCYPFTWDVSARESGEAYAKFLDEAFSGRWIACRPSG
jgi:hypothetical protein